MKKKNEDLKAKSNTLEKENIISVNLTNQLIKENKNATKSIQLILCSWLGINETPIYDDQIIENVQLLQIQMYEQKYKWVKKRY